MTPDLVEKQLTILSDKVSQLTELYKLTLSRAIANSVVTVSDIARMKGVSPAHLRRVEPYLMPDFGKSGYPDGPARWDIEDYIAWDSKSVWERRTAWQATKKASV